MGMQRNALTNSEFLQLALESRACYGKVEATKCKTLKYKTAELLLYICQQESDIDVESIRPGMGYHIRIDSRCTDTIICKVL
jgi:hypothetical protein